MIYEMSGLLSLKWNNHSIAFRNTVSNIRKKEQYCDATIICHGRYYPVHKFVLSTCSEYFEEIFEKIDCKNPIIIIKDVDTKELESLLNYMYEGEVNVLQELLPDLIKSAEALKIRGLAVPDDGDKNGSKSSSSSGHCRGKRFRTSSPIPLNKKPRNIRRSEEIFQSSNDNKDHFVETCNQDVLNRSINEELESATTTLLDGTNKNKIVVRDEKSTNAKVNYDTPQEQGRFVTSQLSDVKLEPVEVEEGSHNYDSNEISFSENINFKDENYISNEDEDSLTSQHDIPQCSTWNDIEPPADGIGLPGLDMRADEIGQQKMSFGTSSMLQMSFVRAKQAHKSIARQSEKKKRFECNQCNYSSNHKGHLKEHLRIHSGDKPFHCHLCPYKATQKQNMSYHMKSQHTGEKPLKCSHCNFRCIVKCHLKRHMLAHHPEKVTMEYS